MRFWHCEGSALIMSLEIILAPGALPVVSILTQLS